MATGYSFSFPQLEAGQLVPVRDNRILLYKLMFPPDLAPKVRKPLHHWEMPFPSQNTLAIIGLIQPTGSIMPISEMQARLFCAQLVGDVELPDKGAMMVDALERMRKMGKRFVNRPRHTIQASFGV